MPVRAPAAFGNASFHGFVTESPGPSISTNHSCATRHRSFVLFNSFEFLFLFLPAALAAFYLLARIGPAWALGSLALASLIFYGWWNPRDVPLLLGSIAFNHAIGRRLNGPHAKPVLAAAILANLALLAFFKWRVMQAGVGLSSASQGMSLSLTGALLPLGISFFTFTQLAYLVDIFRARAKPAGWLDYLLFVTYFPHLMAGPLLYHGQVMPQLHDREIFRFEWTRVGAGLSILALGLFKKTACADSLGPYADTLFGAAGAGIALSFLEAWTAALAYGLQLYFDFSGYSDMAIGLSLLFGIRLPINFDSPYRATSLIDFWRRWHISLSRFLRDYVYIPLGGNRHGIWPTSAALIATMLLAGVWHGLGWTFLVWGGVHGVLLALNHMWRHWTAFKPERALARCWPRRMAGLLVTFGIVTALWVPFRADSIATAGNMAASMLGLRGISLPQRWADMLSDVPGPWVFHGAYPAGLIDAHAALMLLVPLTLIVWFAPNTMRIFASGSDHDVPRAHLVLPAWPYAVWAGCLLGAAALFMGQGRTFLYFTF
jgi:alginate O-acetyltransferase complex protein AlgI